MSLVKFLCSGICHQIPERSLATQGMALPLCARCTGMYLGVVLGLLALRLIGTGHRKGLPGPPVSIILLLFLGAWFIDGANSTWHLLAGSPLLYLPSNALRLVTGFGTGSVIACALYAVFYEVFDARALVKPVPEHLWQLGLCLVISGAATGLITLWTGAPPLLWAGLLFTCVIATLSLVNAVITANLQRNIARRRPGPYLLAGSVIAIAELSALAFLRLVIIPGGFAY